MRAAALEFAQAREQVGLKLVLVDSLAESGHALEDQRADLAVVRSDVGMPVNGQTVLIMRRNAAVLLAPAGSALRAVEDLKGHRIGVLQTEQAGRRMEISRCSTPRSRKATFRWPRLAARR